MRPRIVSVGGRIVAILLIVTAIAIAIGIPRHAAAQRIESRFDDPHADERDALLSPENPVIEIAKWTSGALAAAAGIGAFVIQNDAEDRLESLERHCQDEPAACSAATPGGAYADPALEQSYQDIRADYRDSRLLLIGAHFLAVGSVVLFIVDLPRDPTPENIPYEPRSLRIGVRPDGALEASVRLIR